ncbi:hypothetical protein EV363DRAFT_1275841 [Boletus edulis]|uniref:DUF1748-domain-containing protein n=1 Tax=Boletus edulis BED1 TaxID=1328754 RepID=A0AAD4BUW6_BOLED|nr:hypothetical protein EV363DRAFT_1275841 [Boletus edulis]KAF8440294.1 hypothetical protein L210DRAFT_3401248 [Boletus edulis BED1]
MVLGRFVHYAADAILVSTVIAGIRRSSGFSVETNRISDPTIRSLTDRFLGVGETVFDMAQSTAINSEYFKKDSRR